MRLGAAHVHLLGHDRFIACILCLIVYQVGIEDVQAPVPEFSLKRFPSIAHGLPRLRSSIRVLDAPQHVVRSTLQALGADIQSRDPTQVQIFEDVHDRVVGKRRGLDSLRGLAETREQVAVATADVQDLGRYAKMSAS